MGICGMYDYAATQPPVPMQTWLIEYSTVSYSTWIWYQSSFQYRILEIHYQCKLEFALKIKPICNLYERLSIHTRTPTHVHLYIHTLLVLYLILMFSGYPLRWTSYELYRGWTRVVQSALRISTASLTQAQLVLRRHLAHTPATLKKQILVNMWVFEESPKTRS